MWPASPKHAESCLMFRSRRTAGQWITNYWEGYRVNTILVFVFIRGWGKECLRPICAWSFFISASRDLDLTPLSSKGTGSLLVDWKGELLALSFHIWWSTAQLHCGHNHFWDPTLLLWAGHEMPTEGCSGWRLGWNMENRHDWDLRQVSPPPGQVMYNHRAKQAFLFSRYLITHSHPSESPLCLCL